MPLEYFPYKVAYNLGNKLILLDWLSSTNTNTIVEFDSDRTILSIKVCNNKYLAVNLDNGVIRIYNY